MRSSFLLAVALAGMVLASPLGSLPKDECYDDSDCSLVSIILEIESNEMNETDNSSSSTAVVIKNRRWHSGETPSRITHYC